MPFRGSSVNVLYSGYIVDASDTKTIERVVLMKLLSFKLDLMNGRNPYSSIIAA
jgi:hypothetical protein